MKNVKLRKEDFLSKEGSRYKGTEDLDNTLKLYINDIAKYRTLTPEEEVLVATKAQEGCQEAKDILYLTNLKLVISVAKNYRHRGLEFMDLIQEGNEGLMYAVNRFDVTKGFKFSTYANGWIKYKITRALDNLSRTIRVPVYIIQDISHIARIKNRLEKETGEKVTPEIISKEINIPKKDIKLVLKEIESYPDLSSSLIEIKQEKTDNRDETIERESIIISNYLIGNEIEVEDIGNVTKIVASYLKIRTVKNIEEVTVKDLVSDLNISIEEISNLLKYNNTPSSLNAELSNSEGDVNELGDLIEDDTDHYLEANRNLEASEVDKVLEALPYRTKEIIKLYYGFYDGKELTLQEIGEIFSISKERVRQIIAEKLDDELFQRDLLMAMNYDAKKREDGGYDLIELG